MSKLLVTAAAVLALASLAHPSAQLREGRLYIEGEKEPYVQGAIRTFRLTEFE